MPRSVGRPRGSVNDNRTAQAIVMTMQAMSFGAVHQDQEFCNSPRNSHSFLKVLRGGRLNARRMLHLTQGGANGRFRLSSWLLDVQPVQSLSRG